MPANSRWDLIRAFKGISNFLNKEFKPNDKEVIPKYIFILGGTR